MQELSLDQASCLKAKKMMIDTLKDYITRINNAAPDLRPSRSQGKSENHLFAEIQKDLYDYVSGKILSYRIPAPLFTTLNEDAVDIQQLTDFLNKEVEHLQNLQEVDFDKLSKFYKGFTERMSTRFTQ